MNFLNLLIKEKFNYYNVRIAQLVEHSTVNRKVICSNQITNAYYPKAFMVMLQTFNL